MNNLVAKNVVATLTERVRELEHQIEQHERANYGKSGIADLAKRVCDRKREQIAHLNEAIRYIEDEQDAQRRREEHFRAWLANPDGPQAG